jgi:hypothetical protein
MTSNQRTLTGSDHHAGHVDHCTLVRQHSRPRTLTGAPRRAPPPVRFNALIFDEEFIVRFLGSVAHSMVLERNTKVVWTPYRDSSVLNAIYSVLPFGAPGTAEVDTGQIDKINAQSAEQEMHLYESFVLSMMQGPHRVMRFLNAHDEIRSSAVEFVQSVYREVSEINQGVADEVRRGLARLVLIKGASTLVVKTIGLRAGGLPGFLIGSGYDIALNAIDDWSKGESAVAIGVASKSVDKGWKKAVKDTAKNMANIYQGEADGPAAKAEWLQRRLSEVDAELNRKGIAERSAKYLKDARRLERAKDAAGSAQRAANALSAVKYGFFAWDVYKTANRLSQDLHDAGYESTFAGVADAFSMGGR